MAALTPARKPAVTLGSVQGVLANACAGDVEVVVASPFDTR